MTLPNGVDWEALATQPSVPLRFAIVNATQLFMSGDHILMGYSFRETLGQANTTVQIFDGADANGQFVDEVGLTPLQTARDWFGPGGILIRNASTVVVTSGAINAILWVKDIPRPGG